MLQKRPLVEAISSSWHFSMTSSGESHAHVSEHMAQESRCTTITTSLDLWGSGRSPTSAEHYGQVMGTMGWKGRELWLKNRQCGIFLTIDNLIFFTRNNHGTHLHMKEDGQHWCEWNEWRYLRLFINFLGSNNVIIVMFLSFHEP